MELAITVGNRSKLSFALSCLYAEVFYTSRLNIKRGCHRRPTRGWPRSAPCSLSNVRFPRKTRARTNRNSLDLCYTN
jgi:hypothetical protein